MITLPRRGLLAAAAGLPVLAAPRIARAAEVSLAYGPAGPIYVLDAVAAEKGFFRDEGVNLKVIQTDAGTRSRQLVAAGEVTFAHGDVSHPQQLTNRGKKARVVLGTQMAASYGHLLVRRDLFDQGITTPEALADWRRPNGAKPIVAASALGSGSWMYGTYIFEQRKRGRDVTWVAGNGVRPMMAGLQSRQFDALTCVLSMVMAAEQEGFGKLIYDPGSAEMWQRDFGGNVPVLSIYGLDETVQAQPALVQATVNALIRAMAWMRSVSIDEVYALVGEKYFTGIEPVICKAEMSFDLRTWRFNGVITPEDFARGGPVWNRPGTDIPPMSYSDIVDMRFVDNSPYK